MENNEYNPMQVAKRRLFAMRNGVIADTLRRNGCPCSIIFGVNLPQLTDIARELGPDKSLAIALWNNTTTRESMLLAPMLMPHDDFSYEEAMEWIRKIPYSEVADVLCLKLLRHQNYALELAQSLAQEEDDNMRYCGLRLMCNLAPKHPDLAVEMGKKEMERNCSLTRQPATVLISYGDLD